MALTLLPLVAFSQPALEFLGLDDKPITSVGTAGPVITVGTDGDGVYFQYSEDLPDSGWINLGLEGKNVSVVWPHRVGPVGEVVITVGIIPEGGDSIFVYCGGPSREFEPNSDGISKDAPGVFDLAGFPDPAICGEKYAAAGDLYMQQWLDSVWVVVWSEDCIEGCTVETVETSEYWWGGGGFVVAGGGDGFGGPLLLKSTDYGETWEYVEGGLTAEVVSVDFGLGLSATDQPFIDKIFVSEGSRGERIRHSLDGGATWELSYEDGWNWFPEVVFDPHSPQMVFIAGGDGLDTSGAVLFYSEDFGETWTQIPLSMSGPIVGLDVAEDGHVYFATFYNGVYRFPLDELETDVDFAHVPTAFSLGQPFPNPFNPTTTVEFSIPQSALVTLTIYDLLGRKVETIFNQRIHASHHKVQWNSMDVPSGIYFVRMSSGEFTQTRKVTVLK